MDRKGSAVWNGGLRNGTGTVSTASGTLAATPYSFAARFESGVGTNPEELVAAAHAGCFSMAFSAQLGEAGITPERIETSATVSLNKTDTGFAVTKVHLDVLVHVPGGSVPAVETAAGNAKAGCPISRLLNAPIDMTLRIEV